MIDIRPFTDLGQHDYGWLDARYHFSFSGYHRPDRMGWGRIRVWNDDTIQPQKGFPPHPHRDMEIISFIRKGAITHRDSLGNEGRTPAGDVQVMSAGTGIEHSEYNREDEATTLFQIWVLPDETGSAPSWGQRNFPKAGRSGQWEIVASGAAEADNALPLRADAKVLASTLEAGQRLRHSLDPTRHQYLVAASGKHRINGQRVNARDGVAITGEETIEIEALEDCELVLVDTR